MVTVNETLVREILDRLIRLETLVESNIEGTNRRIDETNQRIDETNREVARLSERVDKLNERMDKLFYTMIGLGVAVIAALVTGQILD